MKKSTVILSVLLLACFVNTSAQQRTPDFYDNIDGYITNGYIILRAEDGTLTDEVQLVGLDRDMSPIDVYRGGEDVPDEVTHDGRTYKVVEFGPFSDLYFDWKVQRLKFGKNMRKVSIIFNMGTGFVLDDGFEVSEENKHLKSIDGILYTADGKTLLTCSHTFKRNSPSKDITIPDDVETIASRAFRNCSFVSLKQLPKSLKEIQHGAFEWSNILPDELVVSEGVRVIEAAVFQATNVRKLTLPSTLERFGFIGAMKSIDTIVCVAPTPPALIDENGYTWYLWWADVYPDVVLMVPPESLELYRQHPDWGALFKNIRAYDPTGIVSLTEGNASDGKTYRLDGSPVQTLKPGIYIRDGRKVVVK